MVYFEGGGGNASADDCTVMVAFDSAPSEDKGNGSNLEDAMAKIHQDKSIDSVADSGAKKSTQIAMDWSDDDGED